MGAMPGAYSMPMMPYMMPVMPYFMPVMPTPMMSYGIPAMPNRPGFPVQGNPLAGRLRGLGGVNPQMMQQLAEYRAHPVTGPVENPTVMQIEKPHIGAPTETPEVALDEVLKSIYPSYDRNTGLLEQGFTSLNMMQMVTRLGEHGYSISLGDIIAKPDFDGIMSNMKAGE